MHSYLLGMRGTLGMFGTLVILATAQRPMGVRVPFHGRAVPFHGSVVPFHDR